MWQCVKIVKKKTFLRGRKLRIIVFRNRLNSFVILKIAQK